MAYLATDAIRGLHKGGHSAAKAVAWIRNRCEASLLPLIFNGVSSCDLEIQDVVYGRLRSKSLRTCISPISYSDIENSSRLVIWNTELFTFHKDHILDHVSLRDRVLNDLLFARWDAAIAGLEKHQEIFSHTHWHLGLTFLVHEESSGTSANKHARKTLTDEVRGHIMECFVACASIRAQKTTSPASFRSLMRHVLSEDVPLAFQHFLKLLLSPQSIELEEDLTSLLSLLESLPLIDRYEVFTRIALLAIAQGHPQARQFSRAISRMSQNIPDPVTAVATQTLDPRLIDEVSLRLTSRVWDLYVCGRYLECAQESLGLAAENVLAFQLSELYTKAALYADIPAAKAEPSLISETWHHLRIIYDKGELTEDSLSFLASSAVRLNETSLSSAWLATCEMHSNAHPRDRVLRYAALAGRLHGPRNLEQGFPTEVYYAYTSALHIALPSAVSFRFFEEVAKSNVPADESFQQIPTLRLLYFQGLSFAKLARYDTAAQKLRLFLDLSGTGEHLSSPFAVEEARVMLARCMLALGKVTELQKIIVDSYFERAPSLKRFPMKQAWKACYVERREASKYIQFPILCYLANDNPHTVSMAVTPFLRHAGFNLPSQYAESLAPNEFEVSRTFFLHRVCVPEVLDSLELYSTSEVEAERIKLLRLLAKSVETLKSQSSSEILRITETAELREALHRIEGSRVEVNLAGIREAEESRFKEMFLRFAAFREVIPHISDIALQAIGISSTGAAVYSARKEDWQKLKSAQEGHARLYSIFRMVFDEIRDAFLNSTQFGLDACLSVRIRHGILTQHLRRPFNEKRLFTDQSEIPGGSAIDFWKGCMVLDSEKADYLQQVLRDLTNSVISMAEEMKDGWIQIRTENRGLDGLFDYRFDDIALNNYFLDHNLPDADYNTVLQNAFSILVERTRENLSVVRSRVSGELLLRLNTALFAAETKVQALSVCWGYGALRDALSHCRVEVQRSIQVMSRWFMGADVTLMEDVTVQTAANTTAGMVVRLHPEMKDRIEVIVEGTSQLRGRYFSAFVHLLYFLVDNALKHSGLESEELSICLKINTECSIVSIELEHPLGTQINGELRAEEINSRVRELINKFDFTKVRSEGGSGLVKVLAMITLEFAALHYGLKADYISNRGLYIELKFDGREVIAT